MVIKTNGPKEIVYASKQGPAGPPGADGSGAGIVEKTYQAAEATSSGKVVILDTSGEIVAADTTDLNDRNRIIGVSKTAAGLPGADILVVQFGEVEDPGFNFTDPDNPIFFDSLGVPTQTVPTSGFQLIVGFPISTTRMYVNIRQPIILS